MSSLSESEIGEECTGPRGESKGSMDLNLVASDTSASRRESTTNMEGKASLNKDGTNESHLKVLYSVICTEAFVPNPGQSPILGPGSVPGKTFYSHEQFEGLQLQESDIQDTFIEISSTVFGTDPTKSLIGQKKSTWRSEHPGPRLALGQNFIPKRIDSPHILIHSLPLQEVIRKLVTYYPGGNLTGKSIRIRHPYAVLFHHYNELKDYRERLFYCKDQPSSSSVILKNAPTSTGAEKSVTLTVHHIDGLLSFLEPIYSRSIYPEHQLHQRKPGVATFQNLWLLFKPGIDVYVKIDGQLSAFVVVSVAMIPKGAGPNGEYNAADRWLVAAWNFGYTGGLVTRQVQNFAIQEFGGEREITSLPVFPSEFYDNGEHRDHLERRGRRYWECLRSVPAHMRYAGYTLDRKPRKYNGEIILDHQAYLRYSGDEKNYEYQRRNYNIHAEIEAQRRNHNLQTVTDLHAYDTYAKDWDGSNASREPPDLGGGLRWASYNRIDPKQNNREELTNHQYFLFPHYLLGFALKEKTWMIFDIDNIEEIVWPIDEEAAMKHLILPNRDKEIVKALSRKFMKADEDIWSADYIEDKGAGQVFLLHGPPGTGKTFTVESVAKYAQRPLLSLTVADIGIQEDEMETMLAKWFDLAADWRAVLLIDEADIFLEHRTVADLSRNSLVSVFLRTMEYYIGMLFLTTNRMGHIDDAFLSRIQVALGYKELNKEARNHIWEGFFEKIEHERTDFTISERAKEFVLEDQQLEAMKWNGREIRNALHTAIALATHEANVNHKSRGSKGKLVVEVDKKHFERVSQRREAFVEYRNRINKLDEEGRAVAAKSRARQE